MRQRSFQIPKTALREHASAEAVERVWNRLEQELPHQRPQQRRPSRLAWVPVGVLSIFALGVYTGSRIAEPEIAQTPVVAESPVPAGSPAELRKPEADESVTVPVAKRRRRARGTASSPVTQEEPELAPPADSVEAGAVTPPAAQIPSPEDWQRLALEDGNYSEAWTKLEQAGGFDEVAATASAEQLMTLADIARATGRRERAIAALTRVEASGAPEAPEAAWTLGTMLEQAGDRAGAAAHFKVYRRLSPEGDFAEDALVRQLEAAVAARDTAQAERYAQQYENTFPHGRHLPEVRRQLELLASDAGAVHVESELQAEAESEAELEATPSPEDG